MKRKYLQLMYPGMKIKRWLILALLANVLASFGLGLVLNYNMMAYFERLVFAYAYNVFGWPFYFIVQFCGVLLFVAGVAATYKFAKTGLKRLLEELLPDEQGSVVDLLFRRRRLRSGPRIVTIGGGTGLSVLLRGLKTFTSNITAIVTVADDGGSSGALREELDIVPPGDLRNCVVALSETEPLMERIMQHRFSNEGALEGHSVGNIFLAAMARELGDIELALDAASKILKMSGRVLPSTKEHVRLCAEMSDGSVVKGESSITGSGRNIERVYFDNAVLTTPASAIDAVLSADIIIFGPGSLYTSVIPNLLIAPLRDAICRSGAIKIYICNVMTQPGETQNYSAADHVAAIIRHAGKIIDYAVVNNGPVTTGLKEVYAGQRAYPVNADMARILEQGVIPVGADVVCETNVVRHDQAKLPAVIIELMYGLLGRRSRRIWDRLLKRK